MTIKLIYEFSDFRENQRKFAIVSFEFSNWIGSRSGPR
ncbi:hypothetical protein LEP1GSC168_0866 [Leptospira santarosai str. HAI134]|nr:hypothetical protein LEP1GSC168_0866 [Leptospira santarosai str. HAI134]